MWVEGWGDLPGQLVVVSGASGSGKSSIIQAALKTPGVDAVLSVSGTTRDPRPGEMHGVDYFFMDIDGFSAARARNEFLESAEYNRRMYGTPSKPVFEALAAGKTILLEIEVQGALQVRSSAPTSLFVFVKTPDFRTLERRLRGRGTESEATVNQRLRRAREELAESHWYDVQLVNDDFSSCVSQFIALLKPYGPGGCAHD